jgi:hypothetical protein
MGKARRSRIRQQASSEPNKTKALDAPIAHLDIAFHYFHMHSFPFSSRSQCAMWRSVFISMWLDFLILGSLVATGSAEHVPFLQQVRYLDEPLVCPLNPPLQGFLFDYNIATQPVPIPITGPYSFRSFCCS